MITYAQFQNGPARGILTALDSIFLEALDAAKSYAVFREMIVMLNDMEANRGCFAKAARRYAKVGSPGERELLKGILLLTDFAHIADEISAGDAYVNITRCGGNFRQAYAACVMNAGW